VVLANFTLSFKAEAALLKIKYDIIITNGRVKTTFLTAYIAIPKTYIIIKMLKEVMPIIHAYIVSTDDRSLENLFIILPIGVTSK
jgi:hypothetical protein